MVGKVKQSSSQAAWALLTEGVTSARLEAHGLRHLTTRALKIVEQSSHKGHIHQVAGDLVQAIPEKLDRLETDLDRTSLALARMGQDFLVNRLSLSDRHKIEEAIASVSHVSGHEKSSEHRLALQYLRSLDREVQDMSGYNTFTSLRSQKGLPGATSLPVGDADAYPHSSLPQDSENPGPDRTQKVPGPSYQTPSPVQEHGSDEPPSTERGGGMSGILDPERPQYEKPRTMSQPGEEYGHPHIEQGHRLHQRRPGIVAADPSVERHERLLSILRLGAAYATGEEDGDILDDLEGMFAVDEAGDSEPDDHMARPKVNPQKRQRSVKGPDRFKSVRYERRRRRQKKVYNKGYRRRNKNVIKRYQNHYYKNPMSHRRRKANGFDESVMRVAAEFIATFYREVVDREDDTPDGADGVGVVQSETPNRGVDIAPGGAGSGSGGSGKVIPYNSDSLNNKSWKTSALLQGIEKSTGPAIHGRSKGLHVTGSRDTLPAQDKVLWTMQVQGSKGPQTVRVESVNNKYGHIDIKMACTCNFWQWQGPEYWAKVGGYLLGPPRGTATRPTAKDPKGVHKACKHALAALRFIRSQDEGKS